MNNSEEEPTLNMSYMSRELPSTTTSSLITNVQKRLEVPRIQIIVDDGTSNTSNGNKVIRIPLQRKFSYRGWDTDADDDYYINDDDDYNYDLDEDSGDPRFAKQYFLACVTMNILLCLTKR